MSDKELESTNADDTGTIERSDDIDTGRRESMRESIKSAYREHGGTLPEDEEHPRSARERDERRAEPKGRAARAAREAAAANAMAKDRDMSSSSGKAGSGDGAAPSSALGLDTSTPPARWTKETKQKWNELPQDIKDVITKGEQDSSQGHAQYKAKWKPMEDVLAPHLPTISAFGHQPHQAVERLFQWQQALSNDPKRFFPELLKSFGVSAHDIFPELAAGGGFAQQQDAAQQQQFDPRYVQQIIDARFQPIYAAAQQAQQQQTAAQQARTQQIVSEFSKGKKYFDSVRVRMAQLISAGVAGLNEDNSIDLENAYQAALRLDPNIWAEVQRESNAQARAAAKAETDRKRYAGSSLSPTSPGRNNFAAGKKPARGKSVRETLDEAVAEARDNARY
jgi:hypothetical protein